MAWIILKEMPIGRVYVEARSGLDMKWTTDPDRAKCWTEKHGADEHMKRFGLTNAAALRAKVTDPSIEDQPTRVYRPVLLWSELHKLWEGPEVVLYVPKSEKSRQTGKWSVNVDAVAAAKNWALKTDRGLRIVLGVKEDVKSFYELPIDVLERLSIRSGPHGLYYLVDPSTIDCTYRIEAA